MSGWSQINSGSAIDATFEAAADSWFEKDRSNAIAASFAEFDLGGSRSQPIGDGGSPATVGYYDAPEFRDFIVPNAAYAGFTWTVVVETRVGNASITVTPKLYNVTDASDAVVGAASASVAGDADGEVWAEQTLSFTPTVGKRYRLMGLKSDVTYDAWLVGKIRRVGT